MEPNALRRVPKDSNVGGNVSLPDKALRLSIAVKLSTLHHDVRSLRDACLLHAFDLLLAELISPFSADEQKSILKILENCEQPG